MTTPPELLQGIDHFNRGEYFEAHEAWEAIWLRTPAPLSNFYKGLIQCAVAIHHFRRGNLAGARRLYGRGKRYLSEYAPRTLGVPVAVLLAGMDELFAPLLAAAPGQRVEPDPSRFPTIALDPQPNERAGLE